MAVRNGRRLRGRIHRQRGGDGLPIRRHGRGARGHGCRGSLRLPRERRGIGCVPTGRVSDRGAHDWRRHLALDSLAPGAREGPVAGEVLFQLQVASEGTRVEDELDVVLHCTDTSRGLERERERELAEEKKRETEREREGERDRKAKRESAEERKRETERKKALRLFAGSVDAHRLTTHELALV